MEYSWPPEPADDDYEDSKNEAFDLLNSRMDNQLPLHLSQRGIGNPYAAFRLRCYDRRIIADTLVARMHEYLEEAMGFDQLAKCMPRLQELHEHTVSGTFSASSA